MKLCIISDMHCKYQRDINSPSETLLFSNQPRSPISQHPVVAMLKAIEEDESIKSDILLCLGDLGDKADEQGIMSAWNSVEEIQRKMGIQVKIGIPGNHDVNSRKNDGKDAFSFIKSFHETFPTNDEDLNSAFWGRGFCIQVIDNILFLLINTVHNHDDEVNAAESNITIDTLERIKVALEGSIVDKIKFKICMLHHHPIKHSNIQNYKDSDSLEKGDELITMLSSFEFNIVLHGHKHQPRITESYGLPVFAVGSFSSLANLRGTGINTMFHVVELLENSKKGIIRSWEYNIKDGWSTSNNKNFPDQIGFGENIDIDVVAQKIMDIISTDSKPKLYDDIISQIPELQFIVPEKLIQLGKVLKTTYGLVTRPEFPLVPNLITFLK